MILSRPELREAIRRGEIRFVPPVEEKQIQSASVDLRLGYKFYKLQKPRGIAAVSMREGFNALAGRGLWTEKTLPHENELGKRESYVIEPREFILVQTLEHIHMPNHLIAMVEGRSSYARAGLSMHQTAPWIQPGWNGQIMLEIRNSGPWNVDLMPKNDKLCQLTFMRLTTPLAESDAYGAAEGAQFQGQKDILPKRGD